MDFSQLQLITWDFFLALILGWLVGIQKEVEPESQKKTLRKKLTPKKEEIDTFWSVRSFWLISIFWALMTLVGQALWFTQIFVLSGVGIVFMFIISYYTSQIFKNEKYSPASEFTAVLVYFLWVLVSLDSLEFAIIFSIALSFITGSKYTVDRFMDMISREELRNTLKFAVIAFMILPLLPDAKYSFQSLFSSVWAWFSNQISHPVWTMEFFNPYSLWLFVVVMSGISYLGYILTKIIGSTSGILLSSIIGGLVSSTAVTASMSEQSTKNKDKSDIYAVGALLASGVMFLRVIAVVAVLYFGLLSSIFTPALVMFIVFLAITLYYMFHGRDEVEDVHLTERVQSPFQIMPAIKFAGLILLIKFLAGLGIVFQDVFPEGVFYYTLGLISGLADVDAITMTMATDAKTGGIAATVAAATILIAVMSNNVVKGSIAWKFWEKTFGRKVLFAFTASTIAGIITIVMQNFIIS